MTKAELIKALAQATNLGTSKTELVLTHLAQIVSAAAIESGHALIPGVGKLEVKDRPSRIGRNPKTGEPVQIKAKRAVKFKAAKALKDALV